VLGRAVRSRFPAVTRAHTGGVAVRMARLPDSPFVSLSWVAPAGAEMDPAGAWGRATLAAWALDEGTPTASSAEIAARVERLGGSIGSSADWDAGYLRVEVLAADLERALDLSTEVLLEPTFPEAEIDRLRRQRLADLKATRERPGAIADLVLGKTLFRPSTYGRLLAGSEGSLPALTREDLVTAHRATWLADGLALVAAGNFAESTLLRHLEGDCARTLATRGLAPRPLATAPAEATPCRRVLVVDRPAARQTEIRIGQVGIARDEPRRSVLQVMNAVLGGKFTSRINLNLRERNGFTYGAFSRFAPRRRPGPFSVAAAVQTESAGAAVRETLSELRRITREEITPEELNDARDYLVGVFPYTLQTAEDIAARLEDLAQFDLPDDEVDRHLDRIASTSIADVLEAARTFLDPEASTIVAVGPAEPLRPQLAEFGTVEDVDVESLFG
jgi:zinc protease